MPLRSSRINTALLAILCCLLWSSAFAGVKIGLQYTPPLQFAGIRFFIAGLLILPFALRKNPGYIGIVRRNSGMLLLFAFLQTFLQYLLFYKGISLIPASVSAIIIGSQPVFIAMVAHFFMPGDRMNSRKTLVILVAIAGVVLVSFGKDPSSASGTIALVGVLLMLAINFQSGISNVLIVRAGGGIPPLVISSFSMMVGGFVLFLFSLPFEDLDLNVKPLPYYLSLAWLSILSALAVSIWITLLKRPGVKVSDLNLWKFMIPVFGALLSWLLIPDEHPTLFTLLGMGLISLSLVVLNMINRKKANFKQH